MTLAGRYRLYGVSLNSPFPLPARRARGGYPDISLEPGTARAFPKAPRSTDWFHYRRTPAGWSHLVWTGLFEFMVSPDGSAIRYRRMAGASAESFSSYLLSQVLSFSLLARGVEPLHGTAVAVDGGAAVFLGDCGMGKSTLGAAMLARGFPILTDDLVAIERRGATYVAHPGPARIKLFPRVARALAPGRTGTPMEPGTSKMILRLSDAESAAGPLPIRALYVLDGGRRPTRIEPLPGSDACMELVRAAFNLIVVDRVRLANQFRFVTALASAVPVRRLVYPRSLASLPDVCDAVLKDLRA